MRNLAAGILTLLSSLIAIFIVLEAAFRLFGISPGGMAFRRVDIKVNGRYQPASEWGTAPLKKPSPYPGVSAGEYVPGLQFRFVYASNPRGYFDAENAVEASINNMGTRGSDILPSEKSGLSRMLVLGDSFTFGEGVKDEDTFSIRLERLLNDDGARPWEVINCGVSSYNTSDEVTYLKNRWIGLKPDVVLIVFVINDAYDDSVFGPLHKGYVEGVSRISNRGDMMGSRALGWMYNRYTRIKTGRSTAKIYKSQFTDNPLIPGHNWDDCKTSLREAKELSEQQGFRLALVVFPELYLLDDRYPFSGIRDIVTRECEETGIPVLDLFNTFEGRNAADLWVHPTDHHPNEKAHALAADAIFDFLSAQKLVPANP
ncbi:MAG: SGNH/GDSL hydrolase family protein [Verrucomicrobia bacterium]|nr:SGNH/GDSL hydrolase family protein [Verrucomicrobiota bacterium]